MRKVIWRKQARADLAEVVDYIAARNTDAAQRMKSACESSGERLADHPYLFRVGRVPGTRECVVHPNYVLIYRVDNEAVWILRILHVRRQYP